MGKHWLGLWTTIAAVSVAGCSDVAFGISTRGFDGQANIVVIFGNELVIATRMISSSSRSGRTLETTVEVAGGPLDVAADSIWLSSGATEWGFSLEPVEAAEEDRMRLEAVGETPPWPPGTRVDGRIRWQQGDRTQITELTDLRVERS